MGSRYLLRRLRTLRQACRDIMVMLPNLGIATLAPMSSCARSLNRSSVAPVGTSRKSQSNRLAKSPKGNL